MANFVAIAAEDPQEREQWIRETSRALSPFPGLVADRRDGRDFTVAWSAAPGAPVRWEESERWACLLVGEAIPAGEERRAGAGEVARAWLEDGGELEGWDGFHAMVVYDKERRVLLAGADCGGAFPIYFLENAGAAVVATSPELLANHPRADLSIDLQGLAGILHTCGLVEERSLCRGIRRLAPRKVLVAEAATGKTRRKPQAGFPWDPDAPRRWDGTALEAQVDFLAEASAKVARRHFRSELPIGQLLSGGLDSRMVAGFARGNGCRPRTVTFGASHELESIVARQVARRLGWENRLLGEPYQDYGELARRIAVREHLAAGFAFSFGPLVSDPVPLGEFGRRMLTGLQLDFVASGNYGIKSRPDEYNLGFLPDRMRELLPRGEFRDAYEAMLGEGEVRSRDYPGEEYQRVLLRDFDHRGRHHVGINLWRLSFGAWPVTMSLDREYFSACRALPEASTRDRRAQKLVVAKVFPDLAALPLDQNAIHWAYLPGARPSLRAELELRLRRRWNSWHGREMRYYEMAYNLDAPHWRRIRRLAEPGREIVAGWFDRAAFDRILAPPDRPMGLDGEDGVTGSAARKILLGLMILAQELPLRR